MRVSQRIEKVFNIIRKDEEEPNSIVFIRESKLKSTCKGNDVCPFSILKISEGRIKLKD